MLARTLWVSVGVLLTTVLGSTPGTAPPTGAALELAHHGLYPSPELAARVTRIEFRPSAVDDPATLTLVLAGPHDGNSRTYVAETDRVWVSSPPPRFATSRGQSAGWQVDPDFVGKPGK